MLIYLLRNLTDFWKTLGRIKHFSLKILSILFKILDSITQKDYQELSLLWKIKPFPGFLKKQIIQKASKKTITFPKNTMKILRKE